MASVHRPPIIVNKSFVCFTLQRLSLYYFSRTASANDRVGNVPDRGGYGGARKPITRRALIYRSASVYLRGHRSAGQWWRGVVNLAQARRERPSTVSGWVVFAADLSLLLLS